MHRRGKLQDVYSGAPRIVATSASKQTLVSANALSCDWHMMARAGSMGTWIGAPVRRRNADSGSKQSKEDTPVLPRNLIDGLSS